MSRQRNIKIDFTGKSYDDTSLFEIGANGSVPSTSSVTYDQLINTGAGYNMTINDATTLINVTSSNGPCIGSTFTSSFDSWPMPATSPIRLSSSHRTGPFTINNLTITGITYVGSGSCDDIYLVNTNQIYRVHNNTGEEFTDLGIFEGSASLGVNSDILYIPEYDCVAVGNNTGGAYPVGHSVINIVSSSGELLYEDNKQAAAIPQDTNDFTYFSGDKYLYTKSQMLASGSSTNIVSGLCRIDLDTMELDVSWSLNVGEQNVPNLNSSLTNRYIAFSGSNDVIQASTRVNGTNAGIIYVNGSTAEKVSELRIEKWNGSAYVNTGATTTGLIQLKDDSIYIAGDFDRVRYKFGTGSFGDWFYQSQLVRTDLNLDFSPYTSSFSRYDKDSRPLRHANNNLVEQPDYDYVIVYANVDTTRMFNTTISGSYQSTSGSIGYLDYTGSMIPFNYPTSAPTSSAVRVGGRQSDNSYYAFTLSTGTIPHYDGNPVGRFLLLSQSGVPTNFL